MSFEVLAVLAVLGFALLISPLVFLWLRWAEDRASREARAAFPHPDDEAERVVGC